MSRLPLAALLLIVAGSAAADDTLSKLKSQAGADATAEAAKPAAAVRGRVLSFPGCDDKQTERVRAAIDDAMDKVDSCLTGYNKGKMARDIKREFKKFDFSCSQETRSSGGVTTHDTDGRTLKAAHISLTMRSRLIQYSLPARVFHEMIHAVDLPSGDQSVKENRDGRYILSSSRHAYPGFPDPVYGCQFACYPGVGDDERREMTRYLALLAKDGIDIPPTTKDIKCEPWEECDIRKRYATLCDTAKPVAPKGLLEADRKANRPTCLAEQMGNACGRIKDEKSCPKSAAKLKALEQSSPLCAIRCEILLGAQEHGGYPPELVRKVTGLGERLSDAYDKKGEGLSDEDKPYYDAAKSAKLFQRCD